jgi:hypothetical protein
MAAKRSRAPIGLQIQQGNFHDAGLFTRAHAKTVMQPALGDKPERSVKDGSNLNAVKTVGPFLNRQFVRRRGRISRETEAKTELTAPGTFSPDEQLRKRFCPSGKTCRISTPSAIVGC